MPNQPSAPNTRTFTLNSPEGVAALRTPSDPWRWGPGLPREPRWPRPQEHVEVAAESDAEASSALNAWLAQVERGNIPIR